MVDTKKRIVVALDYPDEAAVLAFVDKISPDLCRLKIGKEVFTHSGPALVQTLVARGFDVFLDLKFHDIPNTVAKALHAALDLGVWMVNVHAFGGARMMDAAREAVERHGSKAHLIAVTVLTSMQQPDFESLGLNVTPEVLVTRLAGLAKDCGLDGVVCSAQEARALTQAYGTSFLKVTPGIRPRSYALSDDQKRTLSPSQALEEGSDFLVIGRPVTQSANPLDALLAIKREMGESVGR